MIDAALAELGVRRMLLAIHDASFPCDPDEDLGRGTPASRATGRLLPFARGLGFTGLQLGPQGQTSRDNPSPYDGTIFSRHAGTVAVGSLRPGGPYEGLVDERELDARLLATAGGRARHARAFDATRELLDRAYEAFARGARPDLAPAVERFAAEHGETWLLRDARYAAYARQLGGIASRHWPEAARAGAPAPELVESERRYIFVQWLAHDEHARFRAAAGRAGLVLYGDFQVGLADADLWAHRAAFLADYLMGAPPSRTNPEGQPWGYAVLDPAQLEQGGPALRLFRARVEKAFAEYDGLRIDHPHGIVCPWVYRADAEDPAVAVREGARLHESPDLPDHPGLARFAIARPEQLDRARPRYHDAWVRSLDDAQVARYSLLLDVIVAAAAQHGVGARAELTCEVLSTMPLPLGRVLERHGLGRWRVTQKANLDDPTDVYRTENAAPPDWIMLGNHDTRPIFELVRGLSDEGRGRWARHLAGRLGLAGARAAALAAPDRLATAMLAELFLSAAENVSIFFADLFGYEERYNVPGVVSDENWTIRLPADFERLYAERLARGAALDVREALALALDARGSHSGLAARLRA